MAMLAAAAALIVGGCLWLAGLSSVAAMLWGAGVVPALLLLLAEIGRQLWRREPGVDIIAGLAMAGALALGETLAGVVIALMFTGGNVLEEFAQRRANRELTALLARRPRTAHRELADGLEDLPVEEVRPGDRLVVKSGEVLPVDGTLLEETAAVDELALTGEAMPVEYRPGAALRSGTVNAGGPLRLRADTTAADSTYADIVRLVEAAQQQKAPFVRLANQWSLAFLALTLAMAGLAWLVSVRSRPSIGGPGRCHSLPADPGRPRGDCGRHLGRGPTRRVDQGRRRPRDAGAGADRDVRQDGHAHHRNRTR